MCDKVIAKYPTTPCRPMHYLAQQQRPKASDILTGVNPAGDAGDTSPNILVGDVNGNIPPILLRTFGYSRPILVALRSLSLKPISFGYKMPPIRFSTLPHPHPIRWFVPQP